MSKQLNFVSLLTALAIVSVAHGANSGEQQHGTQTEIHAAEDQTQSETDYQANYRPTFETKAQDPTEITNSQTSLHEMLTKHKESAAAQMESESLRKALIKLQAYVPEDTSKLAPLAQIEVQDLTKRDDLVMCESLLRGVESTIKPRKLCFGIPKKLSQQNTVELSKKNGNVDESSGTNTPGPVVAETESPAVAQVETQQDTAASQQEIVGNAPAEQTDTKQP